MNASSPLHKEGACDHLELLHVDSQLSLLLHHVSPLGVQAGLHLSPHLVHLAQHLRPPQNILGEQSYLVKHNPLNCVI